MSDTQWNRYQVFVQEAEGKPHQDYGCVHAPDAELALLNARDVFARRPECSSMWIAPADSIYSITAENLWNRKAVPPPEEDAVDVLYYIFIKWRQSGMMSFAGEIPARTPEEAFEKSLHMIKDGQSGLVWWVLPASCVVKSDIENIDSDFAPARYKAFRLSTDFHTVSDMRNIKQTSGGNPE
jgi:ring-1,2-phenylacetyl-CoA epoxidase subunit PaaB